MPIVIGKKKKSEIPVGGKSNKPVDVGAPKGSAFWGKITGNIENQADLIAYIEQHADHSVEDKPELGKLLVTLNKGKEDEAQYLVSREEYTAPAIPTFSPASGGSGNGSLVLTIACATSGATVQYKIGSGAWTNGTSVTLSQDTSVESKSYTVKARAVKNGIYSEEATATYTVNRRVATPTISNATGNKYSASRSVTISCGTSGATIHYTTDGSTPTTSSPTIVSGGTVTLSTAGTFAVKAIAVLTNWVNSAVASKTDIVIGAGKCYIGQAASVSTAANVEDLANSYERDTMVGWTAPTINFGTTTQYVWFAIPSTAAKNLTVKSEGFGVTLDNAAGTIVGGYRVWRTANKINSSFTFQFS